MEKVDCIIAGGGLAGLSAAYGLASEGMEVLVIERGDYSGAKNVTGGRLYVGPIAHMYPELWDEAPLERRVARELITFMAEGSHTTVEVAADRFMTGPPRSHTVLRAKLDQWWADKVMEKGGMVITKNRVYRILNEGSRVVGISAGGDEIGADVTIISEGALGLLSTEAELRAEPVAKDHAVGFKEIIELPAETIQDRWHLNEGEGAAQLFLGSVTGGLMGGGFLYTNQDSISLGVVVGIDALRWDPQQKESYKLLDEFKEMRQVKPLLAGGETVEYSAHTIPEGGVQKVPPLSGDGYLLAGDAAGLALNALVTVRGMDFAIASGYHAAQTVLSARDKEDFSASALAAYDQALGDSFVLKEMEKSQYITEIMENPRLYGHYPQAVNALMEDVFSVTEEPGGKLSSKVTSAVRRDFLNIRTVKEMLRMRKI